MPEIDNENKMTEEARELQKSLDEYSSLMSRYNGVNDDVASPYDRIKNNIDTWIKIYPKNKEVLLLGYNYFKYTENNELSEELMERIQELSQLEDKLKQDPEYISQLKRMYLSREYEQKSEDFKDKNTKYIVSFFATVGVYAIVLIIILFALPIPSNDKLGGFVLTKSTSILTLSILIFWLARFFNRRIHENVHLAEEYSYRASLLEMFETLKNSVDPENQKEVLNLIMRSITENPNYALHRKKADKIPMEILEILQKK